MRSQGDPGVKPIRQTVMALLLAVLAMGVVPTAFGQDDLATLRGGAIDQEATPPPLSNPSNTDLRRARNYPEQPPTIPHKIRDYQVDLNINKCLTCHGRKAIEESQAPMVSITHFMDREGQMRAFISPRRYFCTQCHVTQTEVRPLTENDFIDVDSLISGIDD